MILQFRKSIIISFVIFAIVAAYYTTNLTFSFSFEQFFPKGDPDLEYYQKFIKDFEPDDNFLLIAIDNEPDVFDSVFLSKFHALSLDIRGLEDIEKVQSPTLIQLPVKTPFGYSLIPLIHHDQPSFYSYDKSTILSDDRFVYNLVDSSAKSLVIFAKTKVGLEYSQSVRLTRSVDSLVEKSGFSNNVHTLGRSYFQREIIKFQKEEMLLAFFASLILVSIIMVFLYRKPIGIIISLGSIALGLLLFTGFLGFIGAELNAVSALFPVIMLIVGSSDVIHIFSKYTDELSKGKEKFHAMTLTINEIGLATFLTSITTAIGFATLSTSKLQTIQEFGLYSAVGVLIAFATVILFTTSALSFFDKSDIIKRDHSDTKWRQMLDNIYNISAQKSSFIFKVFSTCVIVFIVGTNLISTNYNILNNLPKGAKVTNDFIYFEDNYAGFRPIEYAITAKKGFKADDYEVLRQVSKLEDYLKSTGVINAVTSMATMYKSIHNIQNGNTDQSLMFPSSKTDFDKYKKYLDKLTKDQASILLSKDGSKTRISGRIKDIGVENIKKINELTDIWISQNINTNVIDVKRTGTGLILDKNSEYVTASLIKSLGLSICIISILMGWIFKSSKMLIIALIPNVIPLLFAAAILGFFSIELEAGVSIMFTIIFGIAVDDSIHFLSRFKIGINQGLSVHSAVKLSLEETGKAIIITSIILFFGFFIMILSVNPPTFTVGLLISVTLVGTVLCDLFLLPALILKYYTLKPSSV